MSCQSPWSLIQYIRIKCMKVGRGGGGVNSIHSLIVYGERITVVTCPFVLELRFRGIYRHEAGASRSVWSCDVIFSFASREDRSDKTVTFDDGSWRISLMYAPYSAVPVCDSGLKFAASFIFEKRAVDIFLVYRISTPANAWKRPFRSRADINFKVTLQRNLGFEYARCEWQFSKCSDGTMFHT